MGGWQAYQAQRAQDSERLAPLRLLRYAVPRALAEVQFEDESGAVLGLDHFAGKVVLLNLWATWCAPCRKEMPALEALRARLGGSKFEVVALAVDEGGVEAVRAFFRSVGIGGLAIYVDPSQRAAATLGVAALPTTLIVDRKGRAIAQAVGAVNWDSADADKILRDLIALRTEAGKH